MSQRIFIVDDEEHARARLAMLLSDIGEDCPNELVGEAADAAGALQGIVDTHPDIVLMDIQMPGMNGLDLASRLSLEGEGMPAVVFVSAHDDYALDAFEVHALDYLVKPVRAARLQQALRRVALLRGRSSGGSDVEQTRRREHFTVHERDRLLLVPVADVIYLKAELKYVTLRTRTRDYLIEDSLASIEEELDDVFVRVHRNTLVARKSIMGVERGTVGADGDGERGQEAWQVILRDVAERLPISRRQWPVVKALVR
ncbi:LytR/AlgR family response regulator transcription factor [Noviherbaspirillum suwonense]|uniref:Two component transcriptional regulator, LytTR family n=1 Tax=Noviherbaspirillum suwonense TaxID=1224511 RepID=A0ABY1Q092_9BURK|nr:LytTR family DNA-binding domain-containing protein [Noviherbaspirillum suwonense]SMP55233.1 two component transcriptional regulator, LytTR family [Noviherbaspirillum suwonense]